MAIVLIVEDEPEILQELLDIFKDQSDVVQSELERRGLSLPKEISTVGCQSKQEALEWLATIGSSAFHPCPDLVLLDLKIKDKKGGSVPSDETILDGYKVLKYIRVDLRKRLNYDIPVVVLSGNLDPTIEKQGFSRLRQIVHTWDFAPPDDVLAKTGGKIGYKNADELFRKTARYLLDLDDNDFALLDRNRIYYGLPGSTTRRVLRQLKQAARSVPVTDPLPDVLLLGDNGTGKSTLARAYHLFRQSPPARGTGKPRFGFHHEDLGSLDVAGSAASLRLFGGTQFSSGGPADWTLGAFLQTTCYDSPDGKEARRYNGQEVEDWTSGAPLPSPPTGVAPLDAAHYPTTTHRPNFAHSGTLFLDEVINVDPAIRKMLLQALSYNRRRRFVYTTGSETRRIPIGPAIIMATRKKIEDLAEDEDRWDTAKDFMYRIDQVRITIPPLDERLDEVVPYLVHQMKLRRGDQAPPIIIDPSVEALLEAGSLAFSNNFADLDRILDQVNPEERSITFRHIRPLYERSHPIYKKSGDSWDYTRCQQYLKDVDIGKKRPLTITALKDKARTETDMNVEAVYRIVLTFMKYWGFDGKNWSKDPSPYWKYFVTTESTFQRDVRFLAAEARPEREIPKNELKKVVLEEMEEFCRPSTQS